MRKATLGLSLVVVCFAGTAWADHDRTYGNDDYVYDNDYDADYTDYDADDYDDNDDCDHDADSGWISASVALPAIRTVVVEPRAGYVWVEGHWNWTGYDWSWMDGYWMRSRPNHVFAQGRWESSGSQRHWIAGRWNRQPRVIIQRDDRRNDHWGRGNDRGNRGRIVVHDQRNDRGHRGNDRGRGRGWGRGGRR